MKMQKFAILVRKILNINMLKIKESYIVRDYCYYRGEYRGSAHCICNLNYVYLHQLLKLFTMDLIMITILS